MSTLKIKPVLFTGKTYSDGKSPIFIRLTLDRKSTYLSTGYSAYKANWNELEGLLYVRKPKISPAQMDGLSEKELTRIKATYQRAEVLSYAKKANDAINERVSEVEALVNKLKALKKPYSLTLIKDSIETKGRKEESFIAYGEKISQSLLDLGQVNTHLSYKSVLKKLKEYDSDLSFEQLTPSFLSKYEVYLLSDKNNNRNTINKNFKIIRAILYKAMKEPAPLIEPSKNPFFAFGLKKGETSKKERLTLEEMERIKKLDLSKRPELHDARNYFLFSFYNAGIRIGDLMQLRWSNISEEGRLEYKMDKTIGRKSIKLRPETLKILKEYKPKKISKNALIFPILESDLKVEDSLYYINQIKSKTSLINKNLKQLAKLAKIEKNISSHIARHTFGNIARKKNVSVFDISKALGHSSLKVTESYLANFDEETQDETLNKVYKSI